MFEVGATTSFRAFHRMPGQPPPEDQRHPHDYRLEVVAEREDLDERGMVCDLDVLMGALAGTVDLVRDGDLWEVCGTDVVTVEVLAAWIHGRLAAPLSGDGADVVAVRVWESEEAFGGIRAPV
ncbi:MAG TPA: 6-carboxytetrahydropterin synthase [Actinomycetota bacterium]|jgi:6-pyruvoyl-tetrahydropterin synthase